jgi:PTS system IIB component, Glc family (TC 4.A.1)/PTS system IIC component, Glc family (TC 4.A.1)
MDYKQISEELLQLLGGKSNITSNAACMTRLRIGLKDMSKADIEKVKKVEGVLGVVESDTLQIVFGPGKVNKVLDEFYQLTGLAKGQAEKSPGSQDINAVTRENKAVQKAKYDKPVQRFLKKIANILWRYFRES